MPKSNKATTSQILGNVKIKPITTDCIICHLPIPKLRIEALKSLNIPHSKWAHTKCSTITKVKGIYLGESGTSEIKLCDKIYDDTVMGIFRQSAETTEDSED